MKTLLLVGAIALAACVGPGCTGSEPPRRATVTDLPGHEGVGIDTRTLQGPRTMPAETYLRSYIALFGGGSPDEVRRLAMGTDGREMFEAWSDHVGALGLPEHGVDIARASDSNALMLGAYERLGMALCERAAERDLRASGSRVVFDFAPSPDPLDRAAFEAGFDRVHRTMLGYPARLAAGRADAFFQLYRDVVARHSAPGSTSRLAPAEAGWAVVCEGLLRHPEFHLY